MHLVNLAFNLFFPFPRLSQKYFACMVDYHHLSKPSITSATSIVSKKFLMKVQCVIFCGLIQMIDVVGVFLHVVLDIPLDRYINYFSITNYSGAYCMSPYVLTLPNSSVPGYFRAVQPYQ